MRHSLVPLLTALILFMVTSVYAATVTVPGDFPTVQAVVDAINDHSQVIDTVMVSAHSEPSPLSIQWCALTVIGVPDSFGVLPTLPRMFAVEGDFNFRNLHVLGPIVHWGDTEFRGCEIDSGVTSVGAGNGPGHLRFVDCTLRGNPALSLIHYVEVESCRVFGPIIVSYESDAGLTMTNSTMTGPGSVAIALNTSAGCYVADNIIRGFDNGFSAAIQDGQLTVRNNLIEDCPGLALHAHSPSAGSAEFSGNQVLACGVGIAISDGPVTVKNNLILGSTLDGIQIGGEGGEVEGNVVGRSGGSGIVISTRSDYYGVTVQNNTSFGNGGSGFEVHESRLDGAIRIQRNIAYGNDGYGLIVGAQSRIPSLSCNDWFANVSGAVSGMSPSPQDLFVDPLFCDVDNDSVSLTAKSPLLDAPECGLIGARGLGCASTPALVTLFQADREHDGVRVRWRIADPTRLTQVSVERANVVAGPWAAVATEQTVDGDLSVAIDRSALTDREYWYRLVAREGGQAVVISEPVSVLAGLAGRFELVRVTPNPAFGPLRISFTLAREAEVEMDVIDLQGRYVASLVNGSRKAGAHSVEWFGSSAAPGIYFLDYRYPGGHQVERIIRLR